MRLFITNIVNRWTEWRTRPHDEFVSPRLAS